MTAPSAWTPASRPGIVPLHPLGFGTLLGRSFTALRQNPKVLLGFALGVQFIGYLIVTAAVGGLALWSYSRLDTVPVGSDAWNAISAGSFGITIAAAAVLGIAVTALSVIVQGIVVAEVSREVVAEKARLRDLWATVKPVAWRLLGYSLLLTLALVVGLGLAVLALVAIGSTGTVGLVAAVLLGILLFLGFLVLLLWLSTKLSLTTAAIVLERATIRGGIARSWRLIRGRFWPALGVIVIISVSISAAAQVVSVPFSLLTSGISTIIAPTGEPTPSSFVGLIVGTFLVQAVVLLIQSVGIVVQSTATTLIYVDCRMRHEGLDLDLLEYVEKRDAGERDLPDPYAPHPDRPHAPRGWPAPYGQPVYGQSPYGQYPQPAPYGAPPQPYDAGPPPQPQYGQYAPASTPLPPAPPAPPAAPPASTQWAAPGADESGDRPS